jgi:hypothetical protein
MTYFKPTPKSNFYDMTVIPPLTDRIQTQQNNTKISLKVIATFIFPDTCPWQLQTADFLYVLKDLSKRSETPPEVFWTTYNRIIGDHPTHIKIFSDGSKEDD